MLRDSYSMPFSCELVNFRVHHTISIFYRRTSYSVNFYLWEPSGGRDRCRIPTELWERWPKCSRRKLLCVWKWYAIRWWISFRKAVENSTTWCLVSVFVSAVIARANLVSYFYRPQLDRGILSSWRNWGPISDCQLHLSPLGDTILKRWALRTYLRPI